MDDRTVRTVGELRSVLADLPDDMPLYADAEAGHVSATEWEVTLLTMHDGTVCFGFALD